MLLYALVLLDAVSHIIMKCYIDLNIHSNLHHSASYVAEQ